MNKLRNGKGLARKDEWFIDFFAVVWFGSLHTPYPLSPVSKRVRRHTGRLRKSDNLLTGEGGRGWARSRIIRPQGSLILYKSFNTLWFWLKKIVFAGNTVCTVYLCKRNLNYYNEIFSSLNHCIRLNSGVWSGLDLFCLKKLGWQSWNHLWKSLA